MFSFAPEQKTHLFLPLPGRTLLSGAQQPHSPGGRLCTRFPDLHTALRDGCGALSCYNRKRNHGNRRVGKDPTSLALGSLLSTSQVGQLWAKVWAVLSSLCQPFTLLNPSPGLPEACHSDSFSILAMSSLRGSSATSYFHLNIHETVETT